jgi:hypothetical protein
MQFGAVCTILTVLSLASSAQTPASEQRPDAGSIIRTSLERNSFNESRLKDYTYTESQETRTLDKSGAVVKTERTSSEVLNLYGRAYKRRVSKDGRALEGKEKEKADQEFEKEVHKRELETEEQRRKQEEEREKQRAEGRRFLQEIPKAYAFRIAGEETLDGMPVWVIDAAPRPDFHSTVKRADLLKKLRGRLWIDKQSLQWVRAEAEVIEAISFGGFLAKLDRGARMTFLQKRVNDEVWLPSMATARLDARLLVKHLSVAGETTWSNYRKFRVDSRMLAGDDPASPQK